MTVEDDFVGLVPPHDREAEASLVGAIMLDARFALAECADIAQPSMIYDGRLRAIFNASLRLNARGAPVDLVTVKSELDRAGRLAEAGGVDHLRSAIQTVPTAANARRYAELVRDAWIRRESRLALARLLREASESHLDESGASFAARAAGVLARIADGAQVDRDVSFHDALVDVMTPRAQPERIVIPALNATHERLGPLWRGSLLLVSGRPGHGKSQLLRALTLHLAEIGQVLFCAVEEKRRATACSLLAHRAGVPKAALRALELTREQERRCNEAGSAIGDLPIVIDEHGNPSLDYVTAKARRMHHRAPVAAVVVDYMGIMNHCRERGERDDQAIGRTSRGLKRLAKELDCVVIAGTQVTRESQRGGWRGSRPKLHELKDSGSLEADADAVWSVWARAEADPHAYPTWAEGVLELSRLKGRWEPRTRASMRAQQSPLVLCDGAGVWDDTNGDAETMRRLSAYREGVRGEPGA